MVKLSVKQSNLLDYIQKYTSENGFSPSAREIQAAMGWKSTSTVDYHLKVLKRDGFLSSGKQTARTLRVIQNASPYSYFDLFVAAVKAGQGEAPNYKPLSQLLSAMQDMGRLSTHEWEQLLCQRMPQEKEKVI